MDVFVIFFLFALSTLGMTRIMVDGSIFNKPRKWLEQLGDLDVNVECHPWCQKLRRFIRSFGRAATSALECHQCTGFWCGMFCGFLLLSHKLVIVFVCACAGSYISMLAHAVENLIYSRTTYDLSDDEGSDDVG